MNILFFMNILLIKYALAKGIKDKCPSCGHPGFKDNCKRCGWPQKEESSDDSTKSTHKSSESEENSGTNTGNSHSEESEHKPSTDSENKPVVQPTHGQVFSLKKYPSKVLLPPIGVDSFNYLRNGKIVSRYRRCIKKQDRISNCDLLDPIIIHAVKKKDGSRIHACCE